jgi:hypothetical protein
MRVFQNETAAGLKNDDVGETEHQNRIHTNLRSRWCEMPDINPTAPLADPFIKELEAAAGAVGIALNLRE